MVYGKDFTHCYHYWDPGPYCTGPAPLLRPGLRPFGAMVLAHAHTHTCTFNRKLQGGSWAWWYLAFPWCFKCEMANGVKNSNIWLCPVRRHVGMVVAPSSGLLVWAWNDQWGGECSAQIHPAAPTLWDHFRCKSRNDIIMLLWCCRISLSDTSSRRVPLTNSNLLLQMKTGLSHFRTGAEWVVEEALGQATLPPPPKVWAELLEHGSAYSWPPKALKWAVILGDPQVPLRGWHPYLQLNWGLWPPQASSNFQEFPNLVLAALPPLVAGRGSVVAGNPNHKPKSGAGTIWYYNGKIINETTSRIQTHLKQEERCSFNHTKDYFLPY